VDASSYNRGLGFNAELVPYCGKVFRVRTRIERFIDEKTGKMRKMKTPAIILDGVYCQSLYSGKRILCPRAIFLWWREIWLERVSESGIAQSGQELEGVCPAPRSASALQTADAARLGLPSRPSITPS
jgi:hypothetical protein